MVDYKMKLEGFEYVSAKFHRIAVNRLRNELDEAVQKCAALKRINNLLRNPRVYVDDTWWPPTIKSYSHWGIHE